MFFSFSVFQLQAPAERRLDWLKITENVDLGGGPYHIYIYIYKTHCVAITMAAHLKLHLCLIHLADLTSIHGIHLNVQQNSKLQTKVIRPRCLCQAALGPDLADVSTNSRTKLSTSIARRNDVGQR